MRDLKKGYLEEKVNLKKIIDEKLKRPSHEF